MAAPSMTALFITPICPHSLSFRPLVLPDCSRVRIKMPPTARSSSWVSFDGRGAFLQRLPLDLPECDVSDGCVVVCFLLARSFIRPRRQGCSPVLFAGVLLALSICHPGGLLAQEVYPNRAVRMIVPYAPGGTTDILGRLVAQRLSELWKQPVLVDNRAGASGSIGANLVAKSPANG